jgi:iron complex outermembrane receptor protein
MGLRVKANYGRHHRIPTLMELFGYRGMVLPNPGLEPESGLNRDIGAGWEGDLTGDVRLSVEYVYFWSDVDRLIMFVYVPFAQASQAINIESADIEGQELTLSVGRWHGLSLAGNLTYLNAIDAGPVKHLNGKHLPNRPGLEAFARLTWARGRMAAFYEYNYVSGNYWNAYNTKAPNNKGPLFSTRRVQNAGITVPTGVLKTDFTLEVRNLTDARYEDLMGYPLPGRTVYGTATLEF